MPSGRAHSLATLTTAAALSLAVPAALHAGRPEIAAVVPGCLAGLLLTPDLDLGANISREHVRRFMGLSGGLFAWVWALFWMPYARIVRHRSLLSHGLLIGTALRLAYLFALSGLFVALPWLVRQPAFWWGVGGLALADGVHVVMDRIF